MFLLHNHILGFQKMLDWIILIFIKQFPNKRELQQIALNHSSDINTKDFINIYKTYTGELYSFLVNDATLPSDNPLRFRKNIFNI